VLDLVLEGRGLAVPSERRTRHANARRLTRRTPLHSSRKPLKEPVAGYGSIVMNMQAKLRQAALELQNGTFIKP
jgi:redox-sensitive bicupin YhaK (pirin superfamily)